MQASHLNLAVFARGMLKQLYTRMYFADDPANADDPILALVPPERRNTLMSRPDRARSNGWSFDIHLQGERETVFFDV
jgi:protocatechuate 3,4-dioxygenase alpha subunit